MYKEALMTISVNRSGEALKSVKGIVIHYVASAGGRASAVRNNFIKWASQNPPKYASCHDIIDINGDILHIIPYNETAWHVGRPDGKYTETARMLTEGKNPNYYFIGIELCHPDETAKPTDETRAAAISLCADLCKEYGLTQDDIYLHTEIVGADYKECHLYYWRNPTEWIKFKADVKSALMPELTSINDICWQLGQIGIVSDVDGMIAEMEKDPDGRLYWLARKAVNKIRELEG